VWQFVAIPHDSDEQHSKHRFKAEQLQGSFNYGEAQYEHPSLCYTQGSHIPVYMPVNAYRSMINATG
jgi:hypothetical protein